jgi:cation diffusion facilitator family transporter
MRSNDTSEAQDHDQAHDQHEHEHEQDHDQEHDQHEHEHRQGVSGLLRSITNPHSHDAMDSVDSALTSSAEGMRALKYSLLGLVVTSGLQLIIVILSSSVALLADTIHNFADALTAIPLGIAFLVGRRAANRRYTYGYGRAEDLAGIAIVITIAASSALAGWEAVERLVHPHTVHVIGWVIAAGVVGFIGKEWVAQYRIRVGRKIGSAALIADGMHARTDGVTSLAVAVGAVGVAIGWRIADPIVGLLITIAILVILKDAVVIIYRRLMDSVDSELVDKSESALLSVEGIESVETVRIRWVGHELFAEAVVTSDCELSLAEAHDIAEEAHHRLLHEIPRLTDVIIHTDPCGHDGRQHHTLIDHHLPGRQAEPSHPGGSLG